MKGRHQGPSLAPGDAAGSQQQVALGSLLDDQHWHRVKVEVFKAHLNITVDSNTQRTPVPTQLSLGLIQQLSVGAALSPQRSALSENFQGCVENLFYNDLNLIDLAVQKDRQVDMTDSNSGTVEREAVRGTQALNAAFTPHCTAAAQEEERHTRG
ncbi:hypothetical protein NHX12_033253 [Muraenolepis orangiensis]|uniref:Laminin G domain-containing protein n=1 Tax=Muraenolepis orangiensis TaxID=630683 RepID=A0A9Q0III0_9TELE|nr:hypothetical protein NHX12_033253 [Muraenolepis orangiensis]